MVLANIRVLVCGSDFHRVEAALGGTVENTNYAWNRRYDISCTSAPGVGNVDSRLLSMCHLVILTRGSVSPLNATNYRNKPTVSLDGVSEGVIDMVKDCNFYYGMYTVENLRIAVVEIGLSPSHVIWDSMLRCLTETGELSFRRAFWLLDKDGDGVLNEEEIIAWQRSVKSASFSKNDLSELFPENYSHINGISIDCQLFMELLQNYLINGDIQKVWATLHITGLHPDGLPYSWRDIHAIRVSKESNTYLSYTGIQFFRNLYKLRRFHNFDDIWSVTPGCPWQNINGFLTNRIPLDKFIEYWKYMALLKREVVVQYARYWGYKGETSLLFLLRHSRPYREVSETVPNTIQVLVIGTPGCGKKSLIFTLTTGDEEMYEEKSNLNDTYVRTTTFFVRNGEEEVPQTILYVTKPIENVYEIFENDNLEKQVDVVLLCYDSSNPVETIPPIMNVYLEAMKSPLRCCNLPFLVVKTKVDVSDNTDSAKEANKMIEKFCKQHQLLWPPVLTSVENPEEYGIATLNEYMYAVAKEPEIAIGDAPITPMRIIRRAAIVTTFAFIMGGVIRFIIRRVRRKSR